MGLLAIIPPLLILFKLTVKIIPFPVPFNKNHDKGGYPAQYQSFNSIGASKKISIIQVCIFLPP